MTTHAKTMSLDQPSSLAFAMVATDEYDVFVAMRAPGYGTPYKAGSLALFVDTSGQIDTCAVYTTNDKVADFTAATVNWTLVASPSAPVPIVSGTPATLALDAQDCACTAIKLELVSTSGTSTNLAHVAGVGSP